MSNIELLLNYCQRFYDRQFLTRSKQGRDAIDRFEQLLKDYFKPASSTNWVWCTWNTSPKPST